MGYTGRCCRGGFGRSSVVALGMRLGIWIWRREESSEDFSLFTCFPGLRLVYFQGNPPEFGG